MPPLPVADLQGKELCSFLQIKPNAYDKLPCLSISLKSKGLHLVAQAGNTGKSVAAEESCRRHLLLNVTKLTGGNPGGQRIVRAAVLLPKKTQTFLD